MVRPGGGCQVVQPLGDLRDLGVLVRAEGDEVRRVRGDLGRPDDALLVVVVLDDAGDVAPEPMPYEPMTIG